MSVATEKGHAPAHLRKILEDSEKRRVELEQLNEDLLKSKAALEEAYKKYVELYDFAPSGYCTLDKEGMVRDINHAASAQMGRERSEILGTLFSDYIRAEDRHILFTSLRRAFAGGGRQSCEIRLAGKEPGDLWIQLELAPVKPSKGASRECMAAITDIARCKKAEASLRIRADEIREKTMALEALQDLSERVNQSMHLEEVLDIALEKISTYFHCQYAYVRVLDRDTDEFVLMAQKGLTPDDLNLLPKRRKILQGTAQMAIMSGKVTIIEDLSTDTRTRSRKGIFARIVGCRGFVAIPIYAGESLIGSVAIGYRDPYRASDNDMNLYIAIGHLVGTAMENMGLRRSTMIENIVNDIRRIFQVVHGGSSKTKHETGVTGPQLWAIKLLGNESPTRISDLAKRMYLNPSTVVGIVDRLEVRGYVQRTRSSTDRRVVFVDLTDQGRQIIAEASDAAQDMLVYGLKGLTTPQLRDTAKSLTTLVQNLAAQTPLPDPVDFEES